MSGPFGSSQWMYSSGGFYPTEIEQSLRFNDDDSAYLSWTPASAGNRKTFTFSAWVKICDLATTHHRLFDTPSSNYGRLFVTADDNGGNTIRVLFGNGTSNCDLVTSAKYRDTSAWYHIVVAIDTPQATPSNRAKLYVNGELVTDLNRSTYMNQDVVTGINSTTQHVIGGAGGQFFDGYLAEVNFIDGQALAPTDFGEFKSGVWVAKEYAGSYGTNGFYLPFKQTTVANGFNAVTFSSDGSAGSVSGVGFSPDFIWAKSRTNADGHELWDSVRGTSSTLFSNATEAEDTSTGRIVSFDADGFSYGTNGNMQTAGNFVAWCWDAGSGSAASNTDGSITSTVKSNPAYGFSVATYSGTGNASDTIGHGLSSAPELLIFKRRDSADSWFTYTTAIDGSMDYFYLNLTDAKGDSALSVPTSSVAYIGGSLNVSGGTYVSYAFHSVSGYSKISSYSGTGASGNTITTGFPVAFVMIKRTDDANDWFLFDGTRNTSDPRDLRLKANTSDSENTLTNGVQFTDTGFVVDETFSNLNNASGTYIYMAFADTRDAAFWRDLSGNDNTWQPNALQNSDVMPDSPTQNWCVANVLNVPNSCTFSNGNLQVVTGTSSGSISISTFQFSSGKWYWELTPTANGSNSYVGIQSATERWIYKGNGDKVSGGTTTSYGASYTTNDIIGVAIDMDAGTLTFYKNGVSQGVAFTGITGEITSHINTASWGSGAVTYVMNFGQDSSFAGNKTAQGNTDDNGVGDFFYSPPSGYLALCTANLPDPAIDPAQDDVPADYFDTLLWTGNGGTQDITGLTFQPDLVWGKARSDSVSHNLFDSVRGGTQQLVSNTTAAEVTRAGNGVTFNSDGFTLDASYCNINNTSTTTVGWSWLAGNGTSSNTSGSISSTVSVNEKAGFSVVGYTGNGTAGATVGHGLGANADVVFIKGRDNTSNWVAWHRSIGDNARLHLNTTDAVQSNTNFVRSANSTTFTMGTAANNNSSGLDYIAYCFAEVEGYSKFNKYIGNGSTDGPFVYTGFRPAWVLVKRTDVADSWVVHDGERDLENPVELMLFPDLSSAELGSGTASMDFLSNGFKLRVISSARNASGGTYIYMAFAEMPAKYSLGR